MLSAQRLWSGSGEVEKRGQDGGIAGCFLQQAGARQSAGWTHAEEPALGLTPVSGLTVKRGRANPWFSTQTGH